jgi:hypothetical protein
VNFLDADCLAGKDSAEVNFFVTQTDATTVGDEDNPVVKGIVEVGQSLVGTRRRLVDLGGTFHVKSFVGTLLIKNLEEVIEASLLLQEVSRGGFGGFFLQGEVHAFMAAILLGMAGADAFDADAQPKPPDGEFAEVE